MSLFSIIIAARNEETRLPNCLESLKNQTHDDFEVIFVDDGSSDRTLSIAKSEVIHFARFEILTTTGVGLGKARNLACKHARGKFLCFLDADDAWMPKKLETCVQFIMGHPNSHWFYHQVLELYPTGKMRLRNAWPIENLDAFMRKGNPIVPSATLLSRETFKAHGEFDSNPEMVEDLGLWIRLLQAKTMPTYIPEALSIYTLGSGVSNDLEEHLLKVMRSLEFIEKQGIITLNQIQWFQSRKFYEAGRFCQKEERYQEAARYFKKAPFSVKVCMLRILVWIQSLVFARRRR
jgi:glycosyltransferase involved in cell wall biosynthesis